MIKKILTPQQQREIKQNKNIAKHLRIANATRGQEKEKHLLKAKKLEQRYEQNRISKILERKK